MKTHTLAIIGAVILIGALLWFVSTRMPVANTAQEQTTENTATSSEETTTADTAGATGSFSVTAGIPTTGAAPGTATVHYSASGFSPGSITVKKGTTVKFVGDGGKTMWIGSDEHPTHTNYDGTSRTEHCPNSGTAFDQCGVGSSYSFTFNKVGTFEYHDHTQASNHGTVTVTE